MQRRNSRGQYMRDRAERRMMHRRERDYNYAMDYRNGSSEYRGRNNTRMVRDRYYPEEYYMDSKQSREHSRYNDYGYGMNGDYASRGMGRPREYNNEDRNDYRDYADEEFDKEYHDDLKQWTEKLKKYDKFGLLKDQVLKKASEMGVKFEEYDPEEFYAIYLMHVSDYPQIANEPHTYLAMTKSWLDDKDIQLDPSEKVCKYMYEIVMADED